MNPQPTHWAPPQPLASSTAPKTRRWPKILAFTGTALAGAALATGVALTYNQWSSQPEKVAITGTMVLTATPGSGVTISGSTCEGIGGYSDITQGREVALRDATGKLIAVTTLGNGGWQGNFLAGTCTFYFRFDDVELEGDDPGDLFTVQIGNPNRGGVTYPRERLLQGVSLSLGS